MVAGGSYGLGRAIAVAAARRGADVVIGARTRQALDGALAEIEAAGANGLAVAADVSRREQVAELVDATVERFGRIDTYVANAMVTVYAEAHRLEDEELRRVFDVNFFGSVYGYWAALPHLCESHGTFIQIASALSYRGIPLQAAYCSTKAALRTFLESARVEQRKEHSDVDICVILPGAINTPQFDRARQKIGFQPQPVPPIYQPEPFADAVVRCCERPVRELPIGWGAQKLLWGQKLAPRAVDLVLLDYGWNAPAHGGAQVDGLPGQPLRRDAGRSGRPRSFRRQVAKVDAVDLAPAQPPPDRRRVGIGYHRATSRPSRPLPIIERDVTKLALLELKNLHVALEDGTEIVTGVDLAVSPNEVHAVMGPNGSGKSTLAYALMGHPAYKITAGQILFDGEDVTELEADERAQRGLFLAFQYPHAVPGVTVTSFLRSAINAIRKAKADGQDDPVPIPEFKTELLGAMDRLKVSRDLASRYLNDGFSGGEKKRVEILQMAMLKPRIAVLDETDSGLDIDALKVVAEGVKALVGPEMGAVVITHYQRILNYITPDFVHVFIGGRIVEEGGPELAHKLEAEGYERYGVPA